jgi:opacity protein-like surface antigen
MFNKFFKNILTVILFTIILTTLTSAQITLQVGGGMGIATPGGDYGGTTIDFYNGTKYGLETGTNFHAKARVGVLSFNIFGMIDYSTLNGDGESEPGKGKVEVSQSVFSLKVGPEFHIGIPLAPVGVYFDGSIGLNSINGEVIFNGVSEVPSGTYNVESESRVGFGLGGGVLFDIIPMLTIDLGVHYNWLNPFGKQYRSELPSSHPRLDVYTTLNDDKDPLFEVSEDNIIENSRSMETMQFTLTLLFGL